MFRSDKIGLVALDLDGTLLADDKSVPAPNRRELGKLRGAGIETSICSGRALPGIKAILTELGTECVGRYHIGLNGGILYDAAEDRVVEGYPIGKEAVEAVIRIGRSLADEVNIQLYTKETVYIEQRKPSTALYERLNRCHLTLIPDLMEKADEAIKVILILHEGEALTDTETIQRLGARLTPLLPEGTTGCCSCEYLYEILSRDHSKGTALTRLAERLGLSREQVLALGDNENDREMLSYAGHTATVASAVPKIRTMCEYISPLTNNQGGVAEAIEKIIFTETERE